jgi:hypothetical protein
MSVDPDETQITGHDARVIWRTVTVASIVVAACLSGIVYVVAEWTKLGARVESVERWQASKDREASRELWRRQWEQPHERTPVVPPKG